MFSQRSDWIKSQSKGYCSVEFEKKVNHKKNYDIILTKESNLALQHCHCTKNGVFHQGFLLLL